MIELMSIICVYNNKKILEENKRIIRHNKEMAQKEKQKNLEEKIIDAYFKQEDEL